MTETTTADHKHEFPVQPPEGSLLNPGPCRECGVTVEQARAQKALTEALAALAGAPETAMVLCGNEGHLDEMDELPPAVVRITWPGGRFKPTTGCLDCLNTLMADYVLTDECDGTRHGILLEPVGRPVDFAARDRTVQDDLEAAHFRVASLEADIRLAFDHISTGAMSPEARGAVKRLAAVAGRSASDA